MGTTVVLREIEDNAKFWAGQTRCIMGGGKYDLISVRLAEIKLHSIQVLKEKHSDFENVF